MGSCILPLIIMNPGVIHVTWHHDRSRITNPTSSSEVIYPVSTVLTFRKPVSELTGRFEAELHGEVTCLLPPALGHQQPLPALLRPVLQQLPLRLPVNPQQPRTQSLVQPQEEVPVVVDEEQVVDAVQLLLVLRLGVAQVHLLPGCTRTHLHRSRYRGGCGGPCSLTHATGGGGGGLWFRRLGRAAAPPPGLAIELLLELGLGLRLGRLGLRLTSCGWCCSWGIVRITISSCSSCSSCS